MSAPTTTPQSMRDAIIDMISKLPAEASAADIMAAIYAQQAIEEGLRQLDAGQGIPHEEVMKRAAKWLP